jgi:hypothetical protein
MTGKNIALALVLAAITLIAVRLVYFGAGQDDKALIRQALAESIKASKEGRPGGVLDKISVDFKVNQQSPSRNDIADVIKKSRPDVVVTQPDPVVHESDGTAQINSPVKLSLDMLNQHIEREIPNVTIRFKREDSRQWLIFPSKQWRVTEVLIPAESLPEMPSFGFP